MFSENLKKLRKERNISQKKLAEELFISQQAIAKWETDKASPNPEMLARIAEYFGTTTDYLIGREKNAKNNNHTSSDYSDVKVALFGGDGEVTDAMWDEVKQFADYVKAKYLKEKK